MEFSSCSDCRHYYDDNEDCCENCIHNYTEQFESITIGEQIKHMGKKELASLLYTIVNDEKISRKFTDTKNIIKWLDIPAPYYDGVDGWFLD